MRSTWASGSERGGCRPWVRAISSLERSGPASPGCGWAMGLKKPTFRPARCSVRTRPGLMEVRPTPKPVGAMKKVCMNSPVFARAGRRQCSVVEQGQGVQGDLPFLVGRHHQYPRMSQGLNGAGNAADAAGIGLVVESQIEQLQVSQGLAAHLRRVLADASGEDQSVELRQGAAHGRQRLGQAVAEYLDGQRGSG